MRIHLKKHCCLWLVILLSLIFMAGAPCARGEESSDAAAIMGSETAFWSTHPREFEQLYQKVKNHMTREELRAIVSHRNAAVMDDAHMARLEFIASPRSIRMQQAQHRDMVSMLVNEETLAEGVVFFQEHMEVLERAYERMGVKPQDIIAILNWESRLGRYRGSYYAVRIFVGQIFLLDEVENRLFGAGAYEEEGAMPRSDALKRIERIKNRAVNNLGELLIQAGKGGFDPFKTKGSWAGAIGIPQFMPASMVYAADGDEDGVVDLNTVPDAIMSVANYLVRNGYHQKGAEFSFRRYNPDSEYARGVALYSLRVEEMGVNPSPEWVYGSDR